jgi:hypothetical protein
MDTATPIELWISDTITLSRAWHSSSLALWLYAKNASNPHLHWEHQSPNSLWQETQVALVSSSVWFSMNSFNINVQQWSGVVSMMIVTVLSIVSMRIGSMMVANTVSTIGKNAQNLTVSQSKETNYEPSIILGYVFRTGFKESGNSVHNRLGPP